MIMRNCRIVRPEGILKGSIEISRGKIKRLSGSSPKSGESIDGGGALLFPGLIDPHVHLRDPGSIHKEDFFTGTCAALAGGYTAVMDMPEYSNPATTTAKALTEKEASASKKAVCDFHIRMGASDRNFQEIRKASPASLKFFTAETKSELTITDYSTMARHFASFPRGKPICIHAEDQGVIDSLSKKYPDFTRARGPLVAAIALAKVLALQKESNRRIHVCHISTELEIELLKDAEKNVTWEVTPHHLFLDTRDYKKLGAFGKMNPPLRAPGERAALWKNIGMWGMIGTDHAPHLKKEKESNNPPSGVPGLETALPLLIDACLSGKLRITKIPELCSRRPAKAFGLKRKGELKPGFDADFVLVDPNETTVIKGEKLFTKCKWSPFEGRKLKGKIKRVFLRGNEVYRDGEGILAKPGFGKKVL
ncbi:MAG: dihydroorotase [Candidatus Micrarchaeota archaeon]